MQQQQRHEFERSVVAPLNRQVRRLRACSLLEGLWMVVVCAGGVMAVELLLDWWLRFRLDTRAVLLVAMIAGIGVAVYRFVVRPMRVRFGAMDIAGEIERRFPRLDALLISAVQFHFGGAGDPRSNSVQLAGSVVDQASRQVQSVRFDDVVNTSRARRATVGLVTTFALVLVLLVNVPQVLGIWFERNVLLTNVQWPKRTRITVADLADDGALHGALDDDLEVRARVDDGYEVPREVEIVYRTQAGKTGREVMTSVGEREFRTTFARVREPFAFRIKGGDDVTDWIETVLSERPQVASSQLTVHQPAYTRQQPVILPEGRRAAEVYRGGRVEIAIRCSKPISQALLMAGNHAVGEAQPVDDMYVIDVSPDESQTYTFDLLDVDGLRNKRPMRFSVRVLADEAPKVRLKLTDVGNLVAPSAVLPVEAEFSDQLGLAEVEIAYQTSAAGALPTPLPISGFEAYQSSYHAQLDWPIAETDAVVGDQVALFARASDFDDVSGPNVGESATFTFRVAALDELLAEMARREQEYRRQFERIAESQERLRGLLLDVTAKLNDATAPDDLDTQLAPLERRQRQIISQSTIIAQQFEHLLAQMRINRLDTPETIERLSHGVITPLSELIARDLSEAADQLRRLAREKTPEIAGSVDPLQARIMDRMQSILDNMLKWEGFQETVTMLREVLRLQRELNEETQEKLKEQGSDVFED